MAKTYVLINLSLSPQLGIWGNLYIGMCRLYIQSCKCNYVHSCTNTCMYSSAHNIVYYYYCMLYSVHVICVVALSTITMLACAHHAILYLNLSNMTEPSGVPYSLRHCKEEKKKQGLPQNRQARYARVCITQWVSLNIPKLKSKPPLYIHIRMNKSPG